MGEFGVVALLDERDNLSRPRTSSLALSELLKRWGRGYSLHNHGAGTGAGVAPGVGGDVVDGESWTRKFEQPDKWSFCLIAAMIAANRRDHEQKTAPEPHTGFQGQGGACRHQG